MNSFPESSESAIVFPKDLGEMPKEQFAKAEFISDHSRSPEDEEKSDDPKKDPTELDLLGYSFTMSPNTASNNKETEQEKKICDDLFQGLDEKKNVESASSSHNQLIDIGEPDIVEPQKKLNKEPEKHVIDFEQPADAPYEQAKVKDEIESDYMNPYAELRTNTGQNQKHEESVAVTDKIESVTFKDDIFEDFPSLNKNDQSGAPKEDDSSSAVTAAAAVAAVAPAEPALPTAPPIAPAVPSNEQPEKEGKSPTLVDTFNDCDEPCIQAEKLFKQFGLVESLIYWRDVKKSGIVFGSGLTILIAMSLFSLISVFSYVSLLVLTGTVSFRIYKNVLQAVQKTSEGHPFKEYLDIDLTLSQEKVQQLTTVAVAHFNALLTELRRLFLVEDLVDSIKFGVVLYCLTYVGGIFNGMTCIIIAFIALFTLPKVYENNKQSIDAYLNLVRSKILDVTEKVKAAVPLGKKSESDKDK
ncbi:reticulon-1 isoform X2 [Toxorhynchites rutilus septentrionalis]|uniref:reticulon-1 isoform X2 n=1 Tax=Toxorhynchites rutilus septentrionalis TaxID=329112 RepID=UPI0024785F5B|nr:reticulon-1 isoform X2 [Toxorhynchites rutilus septentrionalis]